MLSHEENELITRVGQGTPMGNTMRRYWIPALLAREIAEPDGPPVRVRLLGEDLVAFRDTRGRIGLLDEYCPHRRASLFFGRNEECGLRCVYHGWKFDVAGTCVDQLNEPAENQFRHKVHIDRVPDGRAGWDRVGLSRSARAHAGYSEIRLDPGTRDASARDQGHPGMQLAAGPRRRPRHLARADHAPAADRQREARRHQAFEPICSGQGAHHRRRHHRLRLPVRRDPGARCGRDARPHLPFHPAVPSDPGRVDRARLSGRCRTHLGADRRREHDGLQLGL